MEDPAVTATELAATVRRLTGRLLTIGENRLELLLVELQERQRLLQAVLLALGVALCALLAGMALTAAIVVAWWPHVPLLVLSTLAGLYAGAGILLYRRLCRRLQDWHMLSATLDQLRKDRACLDTLGG